MYVLCLAQSVSGRKEANFFAGNENTLDKGGLFGKGQGVYDRLARLLMPRSEEERDHIHHLLGSRWISGSCDLT